MSPLDVTDQVSTDTQITQYPGDLYGLIQIFAVCGLSMPQLRSFPPGDERYVLPSSEETADIFDVSSSNWIEN